MTISKSQWIENEYAIAPADQKVSFNAFAAYLNTLITVEITVVVPPDLSIGTVSESIPVGDRFILQNTANGTYTSLLQNLEKNSINDVIRDLQNLTAAPISATAKTVIETIISNLDAYIANPTTTTVEVEQARSIADGYTLVEVWEVELALNGNP
jgi:hypothetical protein